jgi:ribosomal protein S18 acetylase RimI-like enzyme
MNGIGPALEIRRLDRTLSPLAVELLKAVENDGDGKFFTPHSFTTKVIEDLAEKPGQDLYYLLVAGERALAYGLLRGWNEGYAVPSLGLAVSPEVRGIGLGRLMMEFLHCSARQQGATRVRLRVHFDNHNALALYRNLGYQFDESPDSRSGLLVGWRDLTTR